MKDNVYIFYLECVDFIKLFLKDIRLKNFLPNETKIYKLFLILQKEKKEDYYKEGF